MKLQFCAFTGPDDAVDPRDLAALSEQYPFVEWSILYSPKDAGTPRNPTVSWIERFSEICATCHTCLHLCDKGLTDFIAGEETVMRVMKPFKRIQLNLEYLDAGSKIDAQALAARVRSLPQWEFIVQYGRKYGHFLSAFNDIPHHAVLFDGSAGEGIVPGEWPRPLDGHACGYAGGLNPDNMRQNLEAIARATPAGYTTWVDQETGARTNNVFDLAKVKRVLDIARDFTG